MRTKRGLLVVLAVSLVSSALFADVIFQETSKTEGGAMSQPMNISKVFISGDKYRSQKKMNMSAEDMAKQMKTQQQLQGVNQKEMNKLATAGRPKYPAKILTLSEWMAYPENKTYLAVIEKEKVEPEIRDMYYQEVDAGLKAKFRDEMADAMAEGQGLEAMFASKLSYDEWLRLKIIKEALDKGKNYDPQNQFGSSTPPLPLAQIDKVSDANSKEYKLLKAQYDKDATVRAEYAKLKEGAAEAKKMVGKLGDKMADKISEEMGDLQMSVQLVRIDEGKIFEILPPKDGKKDATAEDLTYKEKALDEVKADIAKRQEKMDESSAKMKANPKYAQFAAQMAPKVSKIGKEKIDGIDTEHWKVVAGSTEHDYWVAAKVPGLEEIKAFDNKLKETIGDGRKALNMALGGMPDMGSMMGSMGASEELQTALSDIEAKGLVMKHVTRQKNASMSSQAMVSNQQTAVAGVGDIGAANQAAMVAKRKGMGSSDPMAMMKMMQGGTGQAAAEMGAKAEENAKNIKPKTGDMEDMVTTTELRVLSTDKIPDAAFEVPAGAQKI
ncbi:MAG: hypothetical protein WC838_07205 [Candidatus Margulisiibacteriota bacterium]